MKSVTPTTVFGTWEIDNTVVNQRRLRQIVALNRNTTLDSVIKSVTMRHEIIETLRNDIAKIEDRQHQEIKRRIEDFKRNQTKCS